MALIDCHECGKKISNEAQSCPSCGAPASAPQSAAPRKFSGGLKLSAYAGIVLLIVIGIGLEESRLQKGPAAGSPAAEMCDTNDVGVGTVSYNGVRYVRKCLRAYSWDPR